MSIYYFDSSVLVKLYLNEKGSLRVEQIANQTTPSGQEANSIVF
jgi:predicted nucleic acid-binding protein